MTYIAIIGGTGFANLEAFEVTANDWIENQYGKVFVQQGKLAGRPIVFLPRHGYPANIPPHRINYRANIEALASLGITEVIGLAAVGSVTADIGVGAIVLPDQIVDYSHDRDGTFFDDEISHIDFTYPYDEPLRQALIQAFKGVADCELHPEGTYGCTQGPRLETAAEIRRMGIDGCTIVGMTGMPEAALVREKHMAYACVSMVVNAGAGLNNQIVDLAAIGAVMDAATIKIEAGLTFYLSER